MMTREEAIKTFEEILQLSPTLAEAGCSVTETMKVALSALRPVSREQVEKVWRGEWVHTHSSDNFWTEVWKCSHCDFEDNYGECFDFCPFCGAAQTDEAMQMVMERLEALKDEG